MNRIPPDLLERLAKLPERHLPNGTGFGVEGVNVLSDEVAGGGGVHGGVVGLGGIPEAEAVVVFGGEDGVLHACVLRVACPLGGVVEVGIEVVEVATLSRGGCIVETELGTLDARLEVRFEALAKALLAAAHKQ